MKIKPIKEIEEYLKKWPIWVSIIFLFLPGILYQLNYMKANISIFSGTLVIVFLMLSLYYSIPFILLGFFLNILTMENPNKKIGEGEFLSISLFSVIVYWAISLGLTLQPTVSFWEIYSILLILLIIVCSIVVSFKLKKKKKFKSKKGVNKK